VDIEQLKIEIRAFMQHSASEGFPLVRSCLSEVLPRSSNPSFVLTVHADWIENHTCSNALSILSTFMWYTMSIEARTHIFRLNIYDKNDDLHCWTQDVIWLEEAGEEQVGS
jgi:hypothetical protein